MPEADNQQSMPKKRGAKPKYLFASEAEALAMRLASPAFLLVLTYSVLHSLHMQIASDCNLGTCPDESSLVNCCNLTGGSAIGTQPYLPIIGKRRRRRCFFMRWSVNILLLPFGMSDKCIAGDVLVSISIV